MEINHPYINFPGTRSYRRANAAAWLAAMLMEAAKIPYDFAYADELALGWGDIEVWIPRASVQRIEGAGATIITCEIR